MHQRVPNPTARLGAVLELARPGKGRVSRHVFEPALSAVLLDALLQGPGEVLRRENLDEATWDALVKDGVLVHPDRAPSPVHFKCVLRSTPQRFPRAEWAVNPKHALQTGTRLPPWIQRRVGPAGALAPGEVLWVQSPEDGLVYPYWLEGGAGAWVRRLKAGLPASALPRPVCSALVEAGMLVPRPHRRPAGIGREPHPASHDLARQGFAVLPAILPPLPFLAYRDFVRAFHRQGFFSTAYSDPQWNEPITQFLQRQLLPVIERVVGTPLRPAESLLAHYRPGDDWSRHSFQEPRAWVLGIPLDQRPASGARPWPWYLEVAGLDVPVQLESRQALLFRGDLSHWRDAQPPGQHSTATYLYYVERGFKGALV